VVISARDIGGRAGEWDSAGVRASVEIYPEEMANRTIFGRPSEAT